MIFNKQPSSNKTFHVDSFICTDFLTDLQTLLSSFFQQTYFHNKTNYNITPQYNGVSSVYLYIHTLSMCFPIHCGVEIKKQQQQKKDKRKLIDL